MGKPTEETQMNEVGEFDNVIRDQHNAMEIDHSCWRFEGTVSFYLSIVSL